MLADKHSRSKPISVEEEQFMRVYYEYKLREVCSAFYFPHKIQVRYSVSKKQGRCLLHFAIFGIGGT